MATILFNLSGYRVEIKKKGDKWIANYSNRKTGNSLVRPTLDKLVDAISVELFRANNKIGLVR